VWNSLDNERTVIWNVRIVLMHSLSIISSAAIRGERVRISAHCYQLRVWVNTARKDGVVAKKGLEPQSFATLSVSTKKRHLLNTTDLQILPCYLSHQRLDAER
jgi:hypothetical protein